MTLFILCFLLGAFLGYVSLRALGWLTVLFLCTIATPARADYYDKCGFQFHNTSSNQMWAAYLLPGQAEAHAGGVASNYQLDQTTGNGLLTGTPPWTIYVRWYSDSGYNTLAETDTFTHNGGNQTVVMHSDYQGSPPPSYYATGCITNTSMYPRRIIVHFTPTTGEPTSQDSGPILPGEGWCYSYTNTTPTQVAYYQEIWSGEGELLNAQMGNPFWANTNSYAPPQNNPTTITPPQPGGGPSPDNYAGAATNTSNLTGQQMASIMTNLVNNLFFGFDNIGRGLGNLGSVLSNTLPNAASTNIDYRPWLTAGTNYMQGMSNSLSQLVTNTGGKLTNNFHDFYVGEFLPTSNTIYSGALNLSNAWYTNLSGVGLAIFHDLTNFANLPTGNPWEIECWTNTMRTGKLNLNPRSCTWWAITNWVKIAFTWLICIYSIYYIRSGVFIALEQITNAEGGAPQSTFSFITWAASNALVYVVLAALPILAASAIQTIYGYTPIVNPLGENAVNSAGQAHTGIRMGIDIIQDAFPLTYFILVMTYLFIWDTLRTAFIVYVCRMFMALKH